MKICEMPEIFMKIVGADPSDQILDHDWKG